jgi:hypothetical protein
LFDFDLVLALGRVQKQFWSAKPSDQYTNWPEFLTTPLVDQRVRQLSRSARVTDFRTKPPVGKSSDGRANFPVGEIFSDDSGTV